MRVPSTALATLVFLTACASDGGGGPVIQLGTNLDQIPPVSNVACQDGYPVQINATFPQPFTAQGAPSCLLLTFFPGAQPSVPGTVISANLRVGGVTGPMRFVRMRILFQHLLTGPERACCSVEEYGPIFTPTAGAITTVPLAFHMTADHIPPENDFTTIAAGDLVGLEVLSPDVPLPGFWVADGGGVLSLPNYLWLPAMTTRGAPLGQNTRSEGSYSGFMPSYNLNFQAD